MLNKDLLLSGGGIFNAPHVIMTVDYTSDKYYIYWGYYEGAARPGAVNRKPYWTKGSGNKLTFDKLIDLKDYKPGFYGTGLSFKNGKDYFTSGDSFRLTRADTKEVFTLTAGPNSLTTFYTPTVTFPFFHDLDRGDTVGIFFDPPPDGYL